MGLYYYKDGKANSIGNIIFNNGKEIINSGDKEVVLFNPDYVTDDGIAAGIIWKASPTIYKDQYRYTRINAVDNAKTYYLNDVLLNKLYLNYIHVILVGAGGGSSVSKNDFLGNRGWSGKPGEIKHYKIPTYGIGEFAFKIGEGGKGAVSKTTYSEEANGKKGGDTVLYGINPQGLYEVCSAKGGDGGVFNNSGGAVRRDISPVSGELEYDELGEKFFFKYNYLPSANPTPDGVPQDYVHTKEEYGQGGFITTKNGITNGGNGSSGAMFILPTSQ